jgi:hypothetical protein
LLLPQAEDKEHLRAADNSLLLPQAEDKEHQPAVAPQCLPVAAAVALAGDK